MTSYRIFACTFVLAALLTACGQRGPLYLPDESATPAVTSPAANAPDTMEAALDKEDNLPDGNSENEQDDEL
ncbi:MAG: lipoprotein [Xanthomonadales bacterium]|nr:lipoprotein [Xanthomonadales bacterium]